VQAQITQTNFAWPQLHAIDDLHSAIAAVEAIVEQGEGPRGDWREAHFGRFKRVLDEYLAMRAADASFEPARPVVAARVRRGEGAMDGPLIEDPNTARVADLFNVVYEVLLQLLHRLLARIDETDDEVGLLADVAVGLMYDGIEPLGRLLSTLSVGPSTPESSTGAPFELFYQPDYLLPHRRAAWVLIGERLGEAAEFAARLSERFPTLRAVAEVLRKHGDSILVRA
jgi:Ferritin-like